MMNRMILAAGVIFCLVAVSSFALAQVEQLPNPSLRLDSSSHIIDFNKLSWLSSQNPLSLVRNLSAGIFGAVAGADNLLRLPPSWIRSVPEDNPARAGEKLIGELGDASIGLPTDELRINVLVFPGYLQEAAQRMADNGMTVENTYRFGNMISARVQRQKLMDVALIPFVKSVWPERIYHTTLDSSVSQINAAEMWNAGYTGTGVKVAVLDTGIDSTHPMLVGRVPVAQSFTGESVNDGTGHGTHVAGIVGGKLNGANTYNGVAPDVTIWNIKVLDNTGHGSDTNIVAGINYAVDPDNNPVTDDGADILNLSFGGPYTDPNSPVVEAVEDAIAAGVVVVIASGNCGPDCPSSDCQGFVGVETPGDAPNAITVGAVDDASLWACFSSGGFVNNGQTLKPDVVAPGVGISSSAVGGGLVPLSGTSAAAPHVSGMVALLLSSNPALSPQNVKDILEQTASDFGDVGKDPKYGSGLIDGSQLQPSTVLTLLKYSLSQSLNVLDVGAGNTFTITSAADDVDEITLEVTQPNQLVTPVSLSKNGLQWTGSYSTTLVPGTYLVTATIENLAHDVTVLQKSFVAKTPSTTGQLVSHNLPAQTNFGQPVPVTVQFQNTGAYDTDVLVELQEWRNDYFERIFFSDATPVSSGQTVSIPLNWTPHSTIGTKTIKLVATFDDTALELDQNVFVEDPDAPIIWSVSPTTPTTVAQPVMVNVHAGDLSALSGMIHVSSPFVQDIPLFTRFDSDFNRTLRGIIEPLQSGDYSFTVEVCDSVSVPHCSVSSPQSFSVSACTVPKSLVVLGSGSPSDFNFLSPSNYCVGFWEDVQQVPSSSFLFSFPFVYWNAGSSYAGAIDENASALLLSYAGNVVLEGDDIALRHGNDALMNSLAHASFVDSFVLDENSTAALNIVRPHHVFQSLSSPLPLDLVQKWADPDVVKDVNGGIPLAAWDSNGSAIIAYQKANQKHLFLGFNSHVLVSSARQTLIENIFEWMHALNGPDLVVTAMDATFVPGFTPPVEGGYQEPQPVTTYLVEGPNTLHFVGKNKGNQSAPSVNYSAYLDGVPIFSENQTLNVDQSKRFTMNLSLTPGDHNLSIRANPDYGVVEPHSLNNDKTYPIWVAPLLPNVTPVYATSSFDVNGLTVKVWVANYGGTPVTNVPVRITVNGVPFMYPISLLPGKNGKIQFSTIMSPQNIHLLVEVDPDNSVVEALESDNSLAKTVYACTKQNILIVNDDDAQVYWESDEDFTPNEADLNASSASVFDFLLKENGYCTTVWNESTQGVPSVGVLQQYPLVIWSTGDYWSQVIDANDEASIRQYSGSILFEGNDIAFDHADDNFLFDVLRVDMNHDVFSLSGNETITLNSSIFPALPSLDVNFYYSSFADAVSPINNSFSTGEWNDGMSALAFFSAPSSRTSFMGFSLDSISSPSDQNVFLSDMVKWLLLASNVPPSPPSALTCNGGACAGNYSNSISLACQGSVDPENDVVTYSVESSYGGSVSNWYNPAWSHRIPIDINMSGSQANFRTSVDIDTSLITNPVFWSNVKSDFSDVRFVYNGNVLKYYRPVYGDNTFASFWIEFDANAGVNTIDMYFGNSSAAYAGKNNPTEFFLTGPWHLVDDFDDGIMSGWTVRSGTWQESGGILARTSGASSEDQITKDWLQRGSSFYIRAQARPTSSCVNTEIVLTRDIDHTGPTYSDEFFGLSVDNACPDGYLYAELDIDHSTGMQKTNNSNPQVGEDNKTEVLISRTGWMGAFIADANAAPFKKATGWESMDHTFPYLSVANYGGVVSQSDEIYTSNAPNHAYDVSLTFGSVQTPSSGGSSAWQEIGTHAENSSFTWDISALGTQTNVGLRCRAIDLGGSAYYSAYYSADQNISLN